MFLDILEPRVKNNQLHISFSDSEESVYVISLENCQKKNLKYQKHEIVNNIWQFWGINNSSYKFSEVTF